MQIFDVMNKFVLLLLLLPIRLIANTPDSVIVVPRYDIMEKLSQIDSIGGKASIHCDSTISNLLKWRTKLNEKKRSFTGYRIQILSVNSYGSDVEELKKTRDSFEEAYQTIPAYLQYIDPDFKIRVGNYHSRLEAIQDLRRIRKLYPASYPVKTEITLEELKRIPMQDIIKEEEGGEQNSGNKAEQTK